MKRLTQLNPFLILIIGITVFLLLALVVYPFLLLLLYSLGITLHGVGFTTSAYFKAFTDIKTLLALQNTFYVAGGVTLLASLFGGGLAWLLTRTDLACKRVLRLIIFLTFIVPSYIMAVAWIELLGRNGYINRLLLDSWHLLDNPLDIYSLEGIIMIMAIHLYPLVFMAVSNALQTTEPTMEKAACLCGANRHKTLLTITFPLILPSLLSIALLVFQQTMACFGVAAAIGLPTGNYILTTRIYSAINRLDLPLATAVSMILVICSVLVFLLYNFLLRRKRYTVLSSGSRAAELIPLGKWRIPGTILVFILLTFTTIIPLMVIIVSSVLKKWGLDISPENFTLINYYRVIFEEEISIRAMRNSIVFGLIAATVATALGSIAAYVSQRSSFKGAKIMEFITSMPIAIPSVVMTVAAIIAWINPPFKLYGTAWIIIVTYIAASLPFVVRNVSGLVYGMDPLMEKAARVSGASWPRTYKDVTLPIVMPGLRTGWILSFLMALREIPISIMLYTFGTETIGVLLFNMRADTGGLETVSAIAVIVIILTIMGHLIIEKFGRSRMEIKRGGEN